MKIPFSERKAVLRKILRRTRRGIQYVEHTEGDGGEMFKAVCAWPGGHRLKEARRDVQVGTVKGVGRASSSVRNSRSNCWPRTVTYFGSTVQGHRWF